MTALLDVSDVTLRYKTTSAVGDRDRAGQFYGPIGSDRFVLLGPSGCGKSTLLKRGRRLHDAERRQDADLGRKYRSPAPTGLMIFQEFDQLLPWKTVLET